MYVHADQFTFFEFVRQLASTLKLDGRPQTSWLEALYKIASKGWHVEILQILSLKTTLLFYLLFRAFLYISPSYLLDCFQRH